jgi:hypothetical protein
LYVRSLSDRNRRLTQRVWQMEISIVLEEDTGREC